MILAPEVSHGDRLLVAVSGGVDSVALLYLLAETVPSLGGRLAVAHLNHGFRGPEAAADAAYVADLAARLGFTSVVGYAHVPALARERGLSAQAAAREARYAFLEREAARLGARWIVLGHQREDQAETVLWRFLRGAGVDGLAGMVARRGRLLRPLLGTSREELEVYLHSRGIVPREDSSNEKTYYLRNRLRHELLPWLRERYNPRLIGALAEMAVRMEGEAELLRDLTATAWPRLVRAEGPGYRLLGSAWEEPVGLRRRLAREILHRLGETPGFAMIERLLGLWPAGSERVSLSRRLWVRRDETGLWLGPEPEPAATFALWLPVPGRVVVADGILSAEVGPVPVTAAAGEVWFAWEGEERLLVRSPAPGDRLQPRGFAGHRKLADLLREAGVSSAARPGWPVVVQDGHPLWLVGLRPGGEEPRPGETGLGLRWQRDFSHEKWPFS